WIYLDLRCLQDYRRFVLSGVGGSFYTSGVKNIRNKRIKLGGDEGMKYRNLALNRVRLVRH
ncbi:MAG: hypothetical protein KAH86_07130, partial [Methanosarcinales archaeon]|nr:hypothetical protein [Methanosarcinales archaeon]